jgi:hypothetical protein
VWEQRGRKKIAAATATTAFAIAAIISLEDEFRSYIG